MSEIDITVNAGLNVDSPISSPCDDVTEPIVSPIVITTTCPLNDAAGGVVYSKQLAASGGVFPYFWTIISGSLPDGLTLSLDGLISGTPTTNGTSSFTLKVTSMIGGSTTLSCQLSVVQVTITSTCPLPDGQVGTPYNQVLTATGGTLPYVWSITSGSLPDGLSLSSGGVISGTPTSSQVKTFTLHVVDSLSHGASKSCQITTGSQSLNFTDNFDIPDTSGPPWNNLGPKWGVTVDSGPANANGCSISSHKAGFFYVAGNGTGYVGAVSNFATYAVVGTKHPLLGTAGYLSEGDLISDSSNTGIPLLTRIGPAVLISGTAISKGLAAYGCIYEKDSSGVQLFRVVGATQTRLGGVLVASVGNRITITAEVQVSLVRIKIYVNSVLMLTYDDTDVTRITTGSMGILVIFCSSGVGAGWDNWACSTPV